VKKDTMTDQPTTNAQPTNSGDSVQFASLEDHIREALRDVVDPEIGMNVIQLGLIREIEIQPENVHVNMILTTPFCPYAPQLMEQVRRTVQETAGRPTTIEMGMEMWDTSMMEEGAGQDWGLFY
jgi:metal-sulfur cluster biosynthetic enzyme